MLSIPTPTTETGTLSNGVIAQFTDWEFGAYTLYRIESPNHTGWGVINADCNLPRIEKTTPELTPAPEFGVSCPSNAGLPPSGAVAYAGQIMKAAEIASTFNEIVANNC